MVGREQTFEEEAGLGSGWRVKDMEPIIPSRPAPSQMTPTVPQYFQGSIPSGFQHDVSFVDTATLTPSAPKHSLMPLGVQGNPISNAAVQSTAAVSGGSTAQKVSVSLSAPDIFNEITQTSNGPNMSLALTLRPEAAFTYFGGPQNTTFGFDVSFEFADQVVVGDSTLTVNGGNPSQADEWALFVTAYNNRSSVGPPDGTWTAFPSSSSGHGYYVQQLNSLDPIIATQLNTGNDGSIAGALLYFGGAVPTPIQSASAPISGTNTILSMPGNTTLGNTLLVIFTGTSSFVPGINNVDVEPTFTDSQGNTLNLVASLRTDFDPTFGSGMRMYIYVINDLLGAAETVTCDVNGGGPFDFPVFGTMTLFEIGPLGIVAQIPRFELFSGLPSGQLPVININTGTDGTLLPNRGGTGLTSPGATDNVLTSDGAGNWTSSPFSAVAKYQTVQDNGTPVSQEAILNFIGATVADDSGNNRTNISIGPGLPFPISFFAPGINTNAQILVAVPVPFNINFVAGAAASFATATTAATASTTFTLSVNGTPFATVNFAIGAAVGTFTQASDQAFVPGDIYRVDGPGTADASLAGVAITFVGVRT